MREQAYDNSENQNPNVNLDTFRQSCNKQPLGKKNLNVLLANDGSQEKHDSSNQNHILIQDIVRQIDSLKDITDGDVLAACYLKAGSDLVLTGDTRQQLYFLSQLFDRLGESKINEAGNLKG